MELKHGEVAKLKVGRYMLMDGRACKIVRMERSAPGKHGHVKFRITGIDVITGAKRQGIWTGHEKVAIPIIEKKAAQVLSVVADKAQLMDLTSYETFEAQIPEEFKEKIEPNIQVIYWNILGARVIKGVKRSES